MLRLTVFSIFLAIHHIQAHFPLVDNAHGGELFDTWDTAAEIEDITRSSATWRVSICGHLYFWLKFTRPQNFDTLMVGGLVPVIERFKDARVAVAVFGRGLPGSNATQAEINQFCDRSPVGRLCSGFDDLPPDLQAAHTEIQNSLGVSDLGVIAVPGIEDVSDCDFGEDPLTLSVNGKLYVESTGGDDVAFAQYHDWGGERRCFFHEEFAGSDNWLVQDKLINLAGDGEHFIVYWSPDDQLLGEATKTSKIITVFGDEGQSEEFSGETLEAGECSQPVYDFYEQDCHGYRLPILPTILKNVVEFFIGERLFTSFFYLPWGTAPCTKSYAPVTPNAYTCGTDTPDTACTNLCHNHGFCPAVESLGPFNTSECASNIDENGTPLCGETCARKVCGVEQNETEFGPLGPGCVETCKRSCSLLSFSCEQVCSMPSEECNGIYNH